MDLHRWDYTVMENVTPIPEHILDRARMLGQDGWELVAVLPRATNSAMVDLYFKQPTE